MADRPRRRPCSAQEQLAGMKLVQPEGLNPRADLFFRYFWMLISLPEGGSLIYSRLPPRQVAASTPRQQQAEANLSYKYQRS
jgi:hypothetical protein